MNKTGYVKIVGNVDKNSVDIDELNARMVNYNITPFLKFKKNDEIVEIDLIDVEANNSWIHDSIFPPTVDYLFSLPLPLRYVPKRILLNYQKFDKMVFSIFHQMSGKVVFEVLISDIARRAIDELDDR